MRGTGHLTLRRMTVCATLTAVLCVLSPLSIPIGTVPISLGLFAVLLCAVMLPCSMACTVTALYLVIGAVGVPVFSGFAGGFSVFIGPLGGYLWGYMPACVVASLLSGDARRYKTGRQLIQTVIACILSTILCYIAGVSQFSLVQGVSWLAAIPVTVLPFLLPDLLKCIVAAMLGIRLRDVLRGRV